MVKFIQGAIIGGSLALVTIFITDKFIIKKDKNKII
jgi:hypothetical protein